MVNTNTNKILTFFTASLIITLFLIAAPMAKFDIAVQGKPVWGPAGEKKCTSDFFSRTCCWIDDDGGYIHERCETCIDNGDGTYSNCKIKDGPVASENPPIPPKPPKGSIGENRAPITNGIEDQTLSSDSNNDVSDNNIGDSAVNTKSSEVLDKSNSPASSQSSSSQKSGIGKMDEQATGFAKKGNTETSPVPPECPKQGPIPPNCTMKPKF